jgi:site-specific DNA-cytosine methylase
MRGKLTCGSLFSGAGGLDYGFKNMGFRIEWAVDCDRAAAAVYSNAIGVEPVVKRVERGWAAVEMLVKGRAWPPPVW